MEKFTVYRSDNGDELWISESGVQDLRKKKEQVPVITAEHLMFNQLFGRKDAIFEESTVDTVNPYSVNITVIHRSTKLPAKFNDRYIISQV